MTWDIARHAVAGARFVGKAEYLRHKDRYLRTSLVDEVVTDALGDAAADDGVIADFDVPRFFATHVAAQLGDAPSPPGLVYDMFTAITLTDHLHNLVAQGLLAHRGRGNAYDYRLALPS